MEYMSNGPLTDLIEQNEVELEERHMACVCSDVLCALAFLHDRHRIHRDIKSDNILMDEWGNSKVGRVAKLRDVFALCLFVRIPCVLLELFIYLHYNVFLNVHPMFFLPLPCSLSSLKSHISLE